MIQANDLAELLGPVRLTGQDLHELAQALERRPTPAIRVRPGVEPGSLPLETQPVPWHPQGRFVTDPARPASILNYAIGDFYIQDAGSLLAVAALEPQPGERICDLCAAPGGKATAILEGLGSRGWLLANEAIRGRVGMLQFTLARHGSTRYVVSQLDPRQLADRLGRTFDAVLVDAPCSGQALLARGKQSRSALSRRQIEHSASRQFRILDAAEQLVTAGGRLVYSTCTFAYRENEFQVEQFLARHPGWHPMPVARLEPWQSPALPACYRLWPHRDQCAGAFAAVLRCENPEESPPSRPIGVSAAGLRATRNFPELDDWGGLEHVVLYGTANRVFAWPDPFQTSLLPVATSGPELAYRSKTVWSPAYALAMRRDTGWTAARTVCLSADQARQFLAGLPLPAPGRGWTLATWNQRGIGWLKAGGGQGKNHLPKAARLVIRV